MNQWKYCDKCKQQTLHIKRGFGEAGSLIGNARYCCLNCDSVYTKKNKILDWIGFGIVIFIGLCCVYLLLGYYHLLPKSFYDICTPPKWFC